MSLEIIIGPMFSGKTTELLRRLTTYNSINKKCIYVNSDLDTRDNEKNFSTHNPLIKGLNIDSMKIDRINYEFIQKVNNYDVIGIDESQLFTGMLEVCVRRLVDDLKKIVIVSGLNGDFKRHKFGKILDLIPHCDSVIKLYPYCKTCSDNNIIKKALFSKRVIDREDVVDVSYDNYIPVCRECYNN
jgi:thymidine kinase